MRAPTKTIDNAQRLRRRLSVPEARLWNRLRTRTRKACFSSPTSVWPLRAGFLLPKARLAIEIDGVSHDMGDRPQRDARRDAWLEKHDVTVMRIPASELTKQIDEAADAIVRMAAERL